MNKNYIYIVKQYYKGDCTSSGYIFLQGKNILASDILNPY